MVSTNRPNHRCSGFIHPLSHHANDRERLRRLTKVQTWHMEKFAEFIAKMAATPDGDGSLLDHSIFMYGSNMSNSDRHNNYPLPIILVGGGNGKLKGAQHIRLPEHTPVANLPDRAQQVRHRTEDLQTAPASLQESDRVAMHIDRRALLRAGVGLGIGLTGCAPLK
jgi:hypothetical protein